jgi:hypothetical protein
MFIFIGYWCAIDFQNAVKTLNLLLLIQTFILCQGSLQSKVRYLGQLEQKLVKKNILYRQMPTTVTYINIIAKFLRLCNTIQSKDLYNKPEALKSLYRSPGNKKKQLVLCKNYVLRHLGITINIKNTKFVKHLPNIGPYGKMFKCLLLRNYKYD